MRMERGENCVNERRGEAECGEGFMMRVEREKGEFNANAEHSYFLSKMTDAFSCP